MTRNSEETSEKRIGPINNGWRDEDGNEFAFKMTPNGEAETQTLQCWVTTEDYPDRTAGISGPGDTEGDATVELIEALLDFRDRERAK